MKNLDVLPADLPIPLDDGACSHLEGSSMPAISLHSTNERLVSLADLAKHKTVLFFYPRTGLPHEPTPESWDLIPGARGCTPQSCGFRDLHGEFKALGFNIFGVSSQSTEYQQEFVARKHIPFEILSDEDFIFTDHFKLPTFEFNEQRLIKRMAMILVNSRIQKVFYPVFPPDKNAEVVIKWIQDNC